MTRTFAIGLALITASLLSQAQPSAPYIEMPLDGHTLKLPQLAGFAPACSENALIAQRAALMTPKRSIFLTCFVDAEKWRVFNEGTPTNFYPLIATFVQAPVSGDGFSPQEFEALRSAAHQRLGGLLANTESARQSLAAQDRQLAAKGIPLTRDNYQQSLQGFFEPPGATTSFSFITARSVTLSEAGLSKSLAELHAVTTVLHRGRLLQLSVVDQIDEQDKGTRVKDITARWLEQFRTLNKVEEK